MRINVAIPEPHVDAPVLDAALEAVTRLNESELAAGEIPTFDKALHYGIKWKPEPPGDEHFDHAKAVFGRRWGDCDDLAPWHAASLRHTGVDPEAQAIAVRSGPHRWHAVVQRADGSIDDPSKRAGMLEHYRRYGDGNPGVFGLALPVMMAPMAGVGGAYIVRPQIAMRPVRGWVQARADLPWHWREHLNDKPSASDWAMTTLHTAPLASTALTGACIGAVELAEAAGFSTDEHMARLCAIADACQGATFEELSEGYGDDVALSAAHLVGSFWSGLKSMAQKAAHAAAPLAATAADIYMPGSGTAIRAADSAFLAPHHKHEALALDTARQHFPELGPHSAAMRALHMPPPDRHIHIHF